jgi:hypothetical protein
MQEPVEQPFPAREVTSGAETLSLSLPAAEDIARFRTELEKGIIDNNLPPDNWLDFQRQTLSRYPRIQQYKDVFYFAVDKALGYRQRMDSFWSRFGQPADQTQADPEHAKLMCTDLLKIMPNEEVKIGKGAFILDVILSDADYDRLIQTRNWSDGVNGMSWETEGIRFHIFKSRPNWFTKPHEMEHSKNRILELTYQGFPQEFLPTGEAVKGVGRLKKSPYFSAYDEIIANFLAIEKISKDQLTKNALAEFRDFLTKTLIEDYMPEYLKQPEAEGITSKEYSEKITSGFKAIFELYDLYVGTNSDINSARMSINILAQFPLESWPAVISLIKQRRSEVEKPS